MTLSNNRVMDPFAWTLKEMAKPPYEAPASDPVALAAAEREYKLAILAFRHFMARPVTHRDRAKDPDA